MKDLTGVERLRQIKFGCGNFYKFHFSKVASRKNSVT